MSNVIMFKSLGGKALPATVYMTIALLYFVSDAIEMNTMIIRVCYFAYYTLTFYYIVKAFYTGSFPKYIMALFAFFILVFIYVLFDFVIRGIQPIGSWGNLDFLFWHFNAIAPILVFYYFGKKQLITYEWFQLFFFLGFIVVYLAFSHTQQKLVNESIFNQEEFTNNTGYLVVSLLPMAVFFNKSKLVKYSCIGLVVLFSILSFKRGAILCSALSLLYILHKDFLSSRRMSGVKRISLLLIVLIGVSFLYFFIEHLYQTSDYFLYRVESTMSGNSSGRDTMYELYFDAFINGDPLHLLFGGGILHTLRSLGLEAHNDWLEYALDLGLIGIAFYLHYWYCFYKESKKAKKYHSTEISTAIFIIMIIFFVRTFISMSFYDMPFYSTIVLGFCIGTINNKQIIRQ